MTTTIAPAFVNRAQDRLLCDEDTAALVCARNIPTCEQVLTDNTQRYEAHVLRVREGISECEQCSKALLGEHAMACEYLKSLWMARNYLELARAHAPVTGAFPCKCSGSGVFRWGGGTVNGVFTGKTGVCFGCQGKGWMSAADRKRDAYYWNHVARISA